jgi:hypothetical protein
MTARRERSRAFVLFDGFLAGTLAGGWLGLVAAFVSGIAVSNPPRFPGEDFVAAVLAGGVLAALCVLVRRAGGGVGPPPRDRAEGKGARNDLLFVAGFATFVVLLFVDSMGAVPLLAPLPAVLVGLLFALAAVRRSVLLRLAGLSLGILYALAGVLVSLAGTFG